MIFSENKQGQIEVQFNWIFVMVVGGLIILMFINIVTKQKEIGGAQVANKVITDLETIATGAGVSRGTAQTLKKPDIDLTFDCLGCDCKFEMEGSSKQFGDKILFAPSKITGRQFIAWTQDWNAPFRVNNFLYLTSPINMYVIVNLIPDEEIKEMIEDSLPTTILREHYDTLDIITNGFLDNNHPVIKIFVISPDPSDCIIASNSFVGLETFSTERKDISISCIYNIENTPTEPDLIKSKTKFFKLDNSYQVGEVGDPVYINGKASIFASFFSHDLNMYQCNIQSAYNRMIHITDIYKERTSDLGNVADYSHLCGEYYDRCEDYLSQIKTAAISLRANPADENKFIDYYNLMTSLNGCNSQLQMQSCPTIY